MGATALLLALGACGPPSSWTGLSPDHRTAFTVEGDEERSCIQVGFDGPRCYDGVALDRIVFASEGPHSAVPVRDGASWRVVVDGEAGPPFEGIGELAFAPAGGRLAYTAHSAEGWHLVVDGSVGEPFDSLFAGSLNWDPRGDRIAVVVWEEGRAVPVVDGVRGPAHDGIASLRFSPDGTRVAWVARDGARARLVVDGIPGPEMDAITEIRFAPGASTVGIVAREGEAWWIVTDRERFGPYRLARHLDFRGGDGRPLWVVVEREGERVMIDGEPGPLFDSIARPALGPEPGDWGYVAHDSLSSIVVLGGRVVATHPWAGNLVFGPDPGSWAYLIRNIDADAVVHDGGIREHDLIVEGTLQFVGDRWAFLGGDLGDRRLHVVIEGIDGVQEFDWETFVGVARTRSAVPTNPGSLATESLAEWVRVEARRRLGAMRDQPPPSV